MRIIIILLVIFLVYLIVKSLFKVGDHVKVTDGPFMEFSGFVKEVNDEKQKLKVSVSIFGRPTPVELDYLQVEKE